METFSDVDRTSNYFDQELYDLYTSVEIQIILLLFLRHIVTSLINCVQCFSYLSPDILNDYLHHHHHHHPATIFNVK